MPFNDDDGADINPERVSKPSLCFTYEYDDDPEQQVICTLTRMDQQDEEQFVCHAYKSKLFL